VTSPEPALADTSQDVRGIVEEPVATAQPASAAAIAGPAVGTGKSVEGKAEPAKKAGGAAKPKVSIETLEQFIAHAYGRKGQRLSLNPVNERLVSQSAKLDEAARGRLQALVVSDSLLAVPRQLLLISREFAGFPGLRAALNAFVSSAVLQHPAFAHAAVQAALRNLPDAPPMPEALATVAAYSPVEVRGVDSLKPSDLQTLRRNGTHFLATWFACNRGLNAEDLPALLLNVLWAPAARELSDETARLRALTEMEQSAGVGLACQRFRQQTSEARSAQEQAQREATDLRERAAEFEDQLLQLKAERDAGVAALEALRESSENQLRDARARSDAALMHLRHDLEQLRGRLVRRLDDGVGMLEVGLTALRNKTPRVDVMIERAEMVSDALRAEVKNLREE